MQLKVLAESIPVREIVGPLDREIDAIFYDSRRVQKNVAWVLIPPAAARSQPAVLIRGQLPALPHDVRIPPA